MATPNDYAEKLRQSLKSNPIRDERKQAPEPLLDQSTVDQLNDFNAKIGVSDRKKQRLGKASEEKKQRLSTGLNAPTEPKENPLAGISRDADSLNPNDEVSKALGLDPQVDGVSPSRQALLQSSVDEQKTSQGLQDTISANLWENDVTFQQDLISKSDFVDTTQFTVTDGDSVTDTEGKQYRLFGVNTPETRKPESWKLTNADGYNNTMRKANDGHRAYLNYSGQDPENFTLDSYFNNGEKAKAITQKFFTDNPALRKVVIPTQDQSGRGAEMVDWVNPQGVKLSDLLRYRPETNDGFYKDQKAITGYDQTNRAAALDAQRKEGLNSPSFDGEINDNNALLTVPRYLSQGIDTAAEQSIGGVRGVIEGVNTLGAKLYAGSDTAKLENVDKAEAKLKQARKEQQEQFTSGIQGNKDITLDSNRMASLQRRFKENPDGEFSTKELQALDKVGLQVDYKPLEKTSVPYDKRKEFLNQKFDLKHIDDPQVTKRLGKDLVSAIKVAKGVNGVSELDLKNTLNATRKNTKLIRDYFQESIQSNAHLTANAKKHVAQVFDDVKETVLLESTIKEFKDGNWISGLVGGGDTLGHVVYDGLAGLVNHPTATGDTLATSVGASVAVMASGIVGFGLMVSDRINKLQTEARKTKGGELDTGEAALVTAMAVGAAAADASAIHYLKSIGTKLSPTNILKGDAEYLRTKVLNVDVANSIIANSNNTIASKVATLYRTSTDKIMKMGSVGVTYAATPTKFIKGKLDPTIARILTPKSELGKIFNKAVGTTTNFGQNMVILGAVGGKDAVIWAAKKAKELPRWGRTRTAIGMIADFTSSAGTEALTEAFVQFAEQTAKNIGDTSKNDLSAIVKGAREGAAGGLAIGSPSIAIGAFERKSRLAADNLNKVILEAAYNVVNATPEKIRERVNNPTSKAFDSDKAYDLILSKDYSKILSDPDISEKDITDDLTSLKTVYVKEIASTLKEISSERNSIQGKDESTVAEIKDRITKLKDRAAELKDRIGKLTLDNVKASLFNDGTTTKAKKITPDTIREDSFEYIKEANSVSSKLVDSLESEDIASASNLLSQHKVKLETALKSIDSTQSPELIQVIEDKIKAEYASTETRLKTVVREGTKELLVKNQLKDGRVLDTETITSIDDSSDSIEINKVDANLHENLIPRTTATFGSTQTERDSHRGFLESIVNNKALSVSSKKQASEMLTLLDQFDQSANDLLELEKDTAANKIALRSGDNKTIFTVFKEVLSATTNQAGKLGLKGHMESVFSAIANGKTTEVKASIEALSNWKTGHSLKVAKLKEAINQVESSDRGSVTVKLSDTSATLEIRAGELTPAKKLLKYMQNELKLMESSYKAIKFQASNVESIAKSDSSQLNDLDTAKTIEATTLLGRKEASQTIQDKLNENNVDLEEEGTKKLVGLLYDRKKDVGAYLKPVLADAKDQIEFYKKNDGTVTKEAYTKAIDELKDIEKTLDLVNSKKLVTELTLDELKLLAKFNKSMAAYKINPNSIKISSILELQRQNKILANKAESDTSIFKEEHRKASLTKNISKLVKNGTSIKVSELDLKDTLKSVQAGEDVPIRKLQALETHLKKRNTKSPLQRAEKAVVRKHFTNVSSVLDFLNSYNIADKDKRKIAGLVTDNRIDTVESLFKKIDELKLSDGKFVKSLLEETITNEARVSVEQETVDLEKEKLKSDDTLTIDSDIQVTKDSTVSELLLKSVVEVLGKAHGMTNLLFKTYQDDSNKIFGNLVDSILTAVDSNANDSDTIKKLRSVFDSVGSAGKITDSELLTITLQVEKYSDLINSKKSINTKETLTSKNSKDISEAVFKNTKNFKSTIQFLLDSKIITQAQYNLSIKKYRIWFNKQNKIRLESNAYHENPKIRSVEDIINEIKLPVAVISLIAGSVNANAVKLTKRQLTHTVSARRITETEEAYIDTTANEDFIIEYKSEFPQSISDLLNYANGSVEALLGIASELKLDSILNYEPTTSDKTKEKPPTEGQIIRRLDSIIKKRLKFYNYLPTTIKDAETFIKIIKDNEGVLLNYKIALELYKKKNKALLQGDIDTVAKVSAKIEANKTITVEQFMEGYEIVGLGKHKEQKKADDELNIARKKQGLAPLKRSKGYYKKNTKLMKAISTMLYGGTIDSLYLKESAEFRKAKKAYDEYIDILSDTLQFDANQQVIEKSKDRFRLKETLIANSKEVIAKAKTDITDDILASGVSIDNRTFDRILKLEGELDFNGTTNKPVSFDQQKSRSEDQNTIIKDTTNTKNYNSLLRRVVARFRGNSDITAEAVFFYTLAYKNRAITKEFRDKRIRYIKNNPKGSNSVIGTIAKDHTKLTGKQHIIIKQLYKHDSITEKLKKKKKENIGVDVKSKKLIKVDRQEASLNLTNLKINILETKTTDPRDTNVPTQSDTLQQAQSYDLVTTTNQKNHYGDDTAKQVYDIMQYQMVDLADFIFEVGNSNKENMPNSTIPSKEMFTAKADFTKAPLVSKLYGLFDGLANSDKANLILKDIETNKIFRDFEGNSTLFINVSKFYKRLNAHSNVIYGNIDSIKPVLPTHLSEVSEDVLRAFYSKETGKIHNQVVEMASIAFFRYYSSELLGTIDNTPDSVKSMFNIKDEEFLPDETYTFGRTLGTLAAPVILRMGADMASMLNLQIKNPELYANGNLEEAFHAALGNYALEMAQEAGYIKIKSIQNVELDGYKRGRGNQVIGELSSNPNAYTDFLTVASSIDNVTGIRETPDELKQASEDYKEFKGNKFIKDLAGVTYSEQFVTKKPEFKKDSKLPVRKSVPGQKAPSLMTEMAHTASQIEWTVNESTTNDLQLFGATVLNLINEIEDPNEVIEAMRVPVESKARTVDTSIGYLRGILDAFNNGDSIFFENSVFRNIRVSQESGTTRTDKNVRMIMEQKGARVSLNVTDKEDFRILQQSLAVAFDVEYSDKWQENMNEFFWLNSNGGIDYHPDIIAYFDLKDRGNKDGTLLTEPETELRPTKDDTDKDGKAITKATWEFTPEERELYHDGTDAARKQAGWRPHVLSKINELSVADTKILETAIAQTDGGHMGLQALSELYRIYFNYKVKNTSKNLVYAPREIDGKTHGPVAVTWMIASGKLGHSGGMETYSKVIDVIKRGGIVTDKSIAGIYEVFDKDKKDNYKKLTDVAVTKLSSILSNPENDENDVKGTKAMIGVLSKSSQVSVAKNTITEPTADKVSIELERDFFKFILIAVIYGSSLNGILDGKIGELEQAIYKKYIEINKTNDDVFDTELKALNETVKQIYGQDVKVPTTRLEVNQFKFNAREIHNSYSLMQKNIGQAIDYANKTQLGSAMEGMKVINNMASVMASITKLEQERLTAKAIKKKAEKLGIKPEFVSLTKKERNAIISQLIESGMMASYSTPSSKGYEEEFMFMEQGAVETNQKMIVKDKTGNGIQYEDHNDRKQSKGSKVLPLGIRDLVEDTSVLPAMVQAMIIDSHIQGELFKHFKEGKLPVLDHVFDAALIPAKGFKDKKYINPGEAMNKALWDIEKNWDFHKEISKRLDFMLTKIKTSGIDYHNQVASALSNSELTEKQEDYKSRLLTDFLFKQKLAKFELREEALLKGDFDYKKNDGYRIAIRELAKKEAIFKHQLEKGYSVISMWKDEIDMHLLDITITKNHILRETKTVDNFPDVDSAYQIPDSERPAELSIEKEMRNLADKGNRIAQWNAEHPNSIPIKTMAELSSRLSGQNSLNESRFKVKDRKFREQQSSLTTTELTAYIKEFDIVYNKEVKDTREEFITSLDQLTPKQLEALNKPQKTFTNNLTNKVKRFADSPIVVDIVKIKTKALGIHNYKAMPENIPKQILAKRYRQRQYKELVDTLIKKEYMKQQQLRDNLNEIVAYNLRNEQLLEYLDYNSIEITDQEIEKMFSVDERSTWTGWEKYQEVAKVKLGKLGFTNSSSSQVAINGTEETRIEDRNISSLRKSLAHRASVSLAKKKAERKAKAKKRREARISRREKTEPSNLLETNESTQTIKTISIKEIKHNTRLEAQRVAKEKAAKEKALFNFTEALKEEEKESQERQKKKREKRKVRRAKKSSNNSRPTPEEVSQRRQEKRAKNRRKTSSRKRRNFLIKTFKQTLDSIDNNDTFGSSPEGARLGTKKETHKVNGNNVLTLFDSITFTGGKVENKTHKQYLHNYIEETLVPLLSELDQYVHLDVHEGGDTNSGENTGAAIKLNHSYTQSRYSSHDMSQQEVYAHEFSHIFWSKMLEKGDDTYMELRDLQEKAQEAITEVMKEQGLPPEAVFYPRDKAGNIEFYHSESNEKIMAKEKFDYIFKSEHGIYEFAVFAETNENVRGVFKEHRIRNPKKTGILELLKSLWGKLLSLFSNGSKLGKLRGDQTVDARLQQIKRYAESEYRKNLIIETSKRSLENDINDSLVKFISGKVTDKYVKFMEKTYRPRANAIKKGKSIGSGVKKVGRVVLGAPMLAFSKRYGDQIKGLHDSMVNNRRNFAYQYFKEIKSNNTKKQAQSDLLHKGTSVNQSINQNIINATVRNVVEGFSDGSNFTTRDWDNLNETIIRGELHHIYQNMGIAGLIEVLNSDKALVDSINLYKRNIGVTLGDNNITSFMLAQAESLASFTALGEPIIRNHAMNTHVIAQQLMVPESLRVNLNDTKLNAIEKDLDVLVSLQHLATMETTALENAVKIIQKEYDSNRGGNNGIVNMMSLHYASQKEVLSAGFVNNKVQLVRGHSKEDIDTHRKLIVAPLSKAKELKKKYGMELYEETGNKNGLFFSKFNAEEDWQNGSFAFNTEGTSKGFDLKDYYHDIYEGDSVSSRLDAAYAHIERLDSYRFNEFISLYKGKIPSKPRQILAPTLAPNGTISSYRTIISHRIKREVLNMKTHAAKSVANTVSDNLNKAKSKETNEEISKLIHEQWINREDYPNSKYVELDPDSKDKEIAEIAQMIPSESWEYLESLFGKGNPVMMTDSLMPLVFGFRKGGLIEFVNDKTGNKMNAELRKYLHITARLWQASVAEWKRHVVVLTPSTFKNNFISNTVVLRIRGLSGSKAARDQVEGLKFMTQYIKDTDELMKLQLKEYSGLASKDDSLRVKALIRHVKNNPVAPLVEGGAYSPNVEDISIKENKIKQVYESIAPAQLVDTINDITDSIPKPIKRVVSNFYITRDTVASDMLTYATQVSDFTARYALYKKLTKEDKIDSEEAIKQVITQFVSYDENTSMPIQWMNDNGVWNFSKYALRSAQTVVDLYKDKPANMLMYHLLDSLTNNPIPNPTQSFIGFNGISLNGASVGDVKESITKPALFNYIPTTPIF